MKKQIPIFAILLGWAAAAWAAPPATLTTLRQIKALSNAEASKHIPVVFEATVSYFHKGYNTLFLQDDDEGMYVNPKTDAELVPGDYVLVRGKTDGSFRPIVLSESITLQRHGAVPKPVPTTYDELIRSQHDCMMVTVRGIVHSADRHPSAEGDTAMLHILTDGGYMLMFIKHSGTVSLDYLLDAEVEVTGVAVGVFDGKLQVQGIQIYVSSSTDLKILKPAGTSPWSLPITPMDRVITNYHVTDRTHRVQVHGTITYFEIGVAVVLQDGLKSLWIATETQNPLQVGDVVEATGFPEAQNGFLALTHGEIRDSHVQAPIAPLATNRQELASSRHIIDLVSIEGRVLSAARGATQDEYILSADGQLFTAVYRHPLAEYVKLPPMKQIEIDTGVRVTGICITENANPFAGQVPFEILLRSFDDIEVIKDPPLLNIRNLVLLVCLLLAIVAIVGGWGWKLEHKMHRHSAATAALEQQRGRILEDINGSRPLADILEKIVGMVSAILDGATCWCELADGTKVGNCPREPHSLEIVRAKIDARSGPALGALLAAFGPESPPAARRTEALADGVRLASLAIETRRLYSDLRHRSEFDQLTEIPNRFAMEKRMDILIEEARENSGIFGLIYIDLDEFKQINDRYGHHIGDLYLQEVAVRMTRQLRGGDMLARLGGDEFAALVSVVRSRADVEEAARRLERCFDAPFAVEDCSLHGWASIGIALYPEDGFTKDSLLNAADAAMYAVKNSKR